nr:hypothetical protein CFP56_53681 [Quercus suber]
MGFATLVLALAPLTSALSLDTISSLWSRSSDTGSRGDVHHRFSKRNTTVIPAPLNVGPSQYWDGVDGPWSSFPIEIGTPPQNIRAFVSTASYGTWAISGVPIGNALSCPPEIAGDCATDRGFQFFPNKSLTWTANSIFDVGIEQNLNLDVDGAVGFDTVTLGWQGSQTATVQHSSVWTLVDASWWIGVLGLNPAPANFTNLNDPQPSFMTQLFKQNNISGLNYAYTAGNQYRFNQVFGSLVLGGYDQNRFTPTNLTFGMYTDIQRDLLVNIQSITSDGGNATNLLPDGGIAAFIDSSIPMLWLPESACVAFEEAFGLVWDENYSLYLVNDTHRQTLLDTNANVTFTLGNMTSGGSTVDIVLPYGAFDLQINFPYIINPNTSYYFPLKRANDTQYTLGRTFLQEAYLIADYERHNFTVAPCLWDAEKITDADLVPIVSPNTNTNADDAGGISGGAIAGIVIGVVALIAILGALLWFFRRRKTQQRTRLAELDAKSAGGGGGEPKLSDDANETNPFIGGVGAGLGGAELDGGQIHELTAPHKPAAQELDSHDRMDPKRVGYSEMEGAGLAHEMPAGPGEVFEMQGSEVRRELYSSDVAKQRGHFPWPPPPGSSVSGVERGIWQVMNVDGDLLQRFSLSLGIGGASCACLLSILCSIVYILRYANFGASSLPDGGKNGSGRPLCLSTLPGRCIFGCFSPVVTLHSPLEWQREHLTPLWAIRCVPYN